MVGIINNIQKQNSIMKFVKLSVFALLLLSVACTNDLNDSDSLVNQQEHVDTQYKAIFFYGEI